MVNGSAAIVVAGGTGERFGRPGGKQLAVIAGRPVLWWAVNACTSDDAVRLLVLVCPRDRKDEYLAAIEGAVPSGVGLYTADSGLTRQESVLSGVQALPDGADPVLVHDGARPVVATGIVGQLLSMLSNRPDLAGVIVGHPSIDTVKVVEGDVVVETPPRMHIWQVQTPQAFRREALRTAHEQAVADGFEGTDDAALVERAGGKVGVVCGPRDNIKVTLAEDLAFVEAALARSGESDVQ